MAQFKIEDLDVLLGIHCKLVLTNEKVLTGGGREIIQAERTSAQMYYVKTIACLILSSRQNIIWYVQ